jgi:hypothetical protein
MEMEPEDLRRRLVEAYGDGPNWSVEYHRYKSHIEGTYGFFVFFEKGTITMGEARRLVDELREDVPVILNERATVG